MMIAGGTPAYQTGRSQAGRPRTNTQSSKKCGSLHSAATRFFFQQRTRSFSHSAKKNFYCEKNEKSGNNENILGFETTINDNINFEQQSLSINQQMDGIADLVRGRPRLRQDYVTTLILFNSHDFYRLQQEQKKTRHE
ncbi:MAG: hypothetical protein IJR26_00515 [Bacteroidales bacterium]|nr:hypothetical protein [Bacteroidales bacterium]